MNILKPRVSVLMTVYNAEKYLKYSVSSILKQSFKSLELVVVDDCSTDNSREVLKSFKDKRIKKFYLKKHSGRTPALNFGLKKTRGKYIAVLDADDVSHKNRIFLQQKLLNDNMGVNIVGTLTKLIDKNGKVIKNFPTPQNEKILNKTIVYKNVYPHSSVMFKKAFLKKIGNYPSNLKYAQDYGLILKFVKNCKLFLIPKNLTYCRLLKTSMTQSKKYKIIIIKETLYLLFFSLKNLSLDLSQKINILIRIFFQIMKFTITSILQFFGFIK